MRYCQFCGTEIPPYENTCPSCGRSIHDGTVRTVRDVIWPKGGGSNPAARLMRILAQVIFWCGAVHLLSVLGNGLGLDVSFVTILTYLIGFLPVTGILLGLAEVIELLDRRNQA